MSACQSAFHCMMCIRAPAAPMQRFGSWLGGATWKATASRNSPTSVVRLSFVSSSQAIRRAKWVAFTRARTSRASTDGTGLDGGTDVCPEGGGGGRGGGRGGGDREGSRADP